MHQGDVRANHHHDHAGFHGLYGAKMAARFLWKRSGAANLAVELTSLGPGDHVVDFGCGPGVAVRLAASHGARVVGVDPSAEMIKAARVLTRSRSQATYIQAGVEDVDAPEGWADIVWSLSTVHHWADLDAGLATVKKLLKPGGQFLALERSVADRQNEDAHGWDKDQALGFCQDLEDYGFKGVDSATHRADGYDIVSVIGTRGEDYL